MLDPGRRSLFVDALRPPPGMTLSHAVATTFTLDLDALTIVPLALAAFDADAGDSVDPIVALETVRRCADRIDLFCQAGQISVPRSYQPLLAYLEESVHEVVAPTDGHIFHPKLWVLLYESGDGTAQHLRVLVPTRNLTFDRSWDLMLRLDQDERHRPVDGLDHFVRSLPGLALAAFPPERKKRLQRLARFVSTTGLAPPAPFTRIERLHSFGLRRGRRANPFPSGADRTLVISPFVGRRGLGLARSAARHATVISRQESLDGLEGDPIDAFDDVLVLDPLAERAPTEDDREAAGAEPIGGRLHAKLYAIERGADCAVLVGSANATNGAFAGNVEVLVELHGHRSTVGVEALLGSDDTGLRSILEPYVPGEPEGEPVDEAGGPIARAAIEVASQQFTATAEPADDAFRLRLQSDGAVELPSGVAMRWWPVSLGPARALDAEGDAPLDLDFGVVSLEAITSFFVFELSAGRGADRVTVASIVNARLIGAPEDRRERLLTTLLRDRHDVLRYLLLLLLFAREGGGLDVAHTWHTMTGREPSGRTVVELPLFESMIQALAQQPETLDRVAALVDELRATDEGRRLLPEGLDAVWDPIWQAREAMR